MTSRLGRALLLGLLMLPGVTLAESGQGGLSGESGRASETVAQQGTASLAELPPRVQKSAQRLAERQHPGSSRSAQSIVVDVGDQRLYLFVEGRLRAVYPVSTAERGTGNREGSLQTPLGLHRVDEKIGANAPMGMIFRGRQPTGELAELLTGPDERAARDDVTTRILWLQGLEPGVNQGGDVDSKQRYIYIHGTPEEGRIGRPASHGCVRMINTDVVALFDRVEEGALVDIIE